MSSAEEPAVLQHRDWWPGNGCFGCGPDNPYGIRLESTIDADGVTHATWTAEDHHCGPPGAVNGGVVAVPMDCHGAWTATAAYRRRAECEGRDPATVGAVTASYEVRLVVPTPVGQPLTLRGELLGLTGRRAVVRVTTTAAGVVTASFEGTFVEVPATPA